MAIFIPLLTFFWFFTHVVEAFVIQHYMKKNGSKQIKQIQIWESIMTTTIAVGLVTTVLILIFTFYVYRDEIR